MSSPSTPFRALALSLVLNGGFLIIEAVAGWLTDSLALLSDALHMLGDVAALSLALVAAKLAQRAAEAHQTFGLKRAEALGAFVNGLGLLLAAAIIIKEGIGRLLAGTPSVEGMPVLIIGAVGLAINLGSAWLLYRSDPDNLNIRGALSHMMADALGSLGAMVAAGLLMAGFGWADAGVSLFIAALVAWSGYIIVRDTGRVLLEISPKHINPDDLQEALEALPGVAEVHDLHVWSLDGENSIATVHLIIPEADVDALRREARALLHDRGVSHVTLETEQINDCDRCCPLLETP